SPVIELNRAVAVAMSEGPAAGLAIVERLESRGELRGYHLLPAVRADLLRRLGRSSEAAESYRAALRLVSLEPERRFLERRLELVASPSSSSSRAYRDERVQRAVVRHDEDLA